MGKGNGKALALDTDVPTPDGWTTMRDLEIGDEVFDESGHPCRVVGTTEELLNRECYELEFDDGTRITADAEHLWYTEQRTYGERGASLRGVPMGERGSWRRGLRTTADIAKTLRYKNGAFESANHSVPLAAPLDMAPASLPIDPYVLGYWLGDGDSDCARITIANTDAPEVVERLREGGCHVGEPKSGGGTGASRYRVGSVGLRGPSGRASLNAKLRAIWQLEEKHIPRAYLRASALQRLSLLHGLMDSDGTISEQSGQCEYTTTKRRLADDVLELVLTLGIKARCNEGRATLKGRDIGPKYRILFHPPHDLPVFSLSRKARRQFKRHNRRPLSTERRIVACHPVPSVPVKCIQVSAPSGMYLAGRTMVPTHNSPLAAGIGLYSLLCDGQDEPDAQIYSAAVSRDQAKIVFSDAVKMVEASDELKELIEVNAGSLIVHPTSSIFRPVSSEHRGLDGKRVQTALVDELHEHPHALVVDKMRAGTKARRNALIFEITNSGYDRTSVCWDHHEYSVKVLEGSQKNETWFAYVCALDEGDKDKGIPADEWTNPKVWLKANPGLGTILPREYLAEQVSEAMGMPSKENLVKRLNFCIWTEQATRWINMALWAKCDPPRPIAKLAGAPCFEGLDLSSTTDITALVLLFPDEDEEAFDVVPFFWIPRAALEIDTSPHKEKVRLDLVKWANQGFIEVTEGNVVDYAFIEKRVEETKERYGVVEIAYDKWNATQLVTRLLDDGAPMVEFSQGIASMNAPAKQFERLVKLGKLRCDNPVMTWMVSNVSVRQDASGNIKPDKESSGEKIDGPVAAIMALGSWMRHQADEEPQESVYDDAERRPNGLLTL